MAAATVLLRDSNAMPFMRDIVIVCLARQTNVCRWRGPRMTVPVDRMIWDDRVSFTAVITCDERLTTSISTLFTKSSACNQGWPLGFLHRYLSFISVFSRGKPHESKTSAADCYCYCVSHPCSKAGGFRLQARFAGWDKVYHQWSGCQLRWDWVEKKTLNEVASISLYRVECRYTYLIVIYEHGCRSALLTL